VTRREAYWTIISVLLLVLVALAWLIDASAP
jgi:hypothetical protein